MTKLWNMIFPIWLLLWWPTWWLAVIPANILWDGLILYLCLGKETMLHTLWKTVVTGFFADFAGSVILVTAAYSISDPYLANAVFYDPFSNIWAFLIVLAALALSMMLIYVLNLKWALKRLPAAKKVRTSVLLAVLTAPYLFFLPTAWFF